MRNKILPLLIIFSGLLSAGFISSLWVSKPEPVEVEQVQGTPSIVETEIIEAPAQQLPIKQAVKSTSSPTSTPTPISATSTPAPTQVPSSLPTPTPTPVPQTNQVNVSITGVSDFSVSVNEGSNQCDVLNKALEGGKISSLNMRFNSSLGSFAVYQINGLGKENSVWWTYKVNGQSPSQGCSYVKANNGDKALWEYAGS